MRLSKLHGLGNDFLVLLDDGSRGPMPAERVRSLCERHTGAGADGLIRSQRVGPDAVTFELANADGSPAEMSGNGARCLGLAAARAGWWVDRSRPLTLHTTVGARALDWQRGNLDEAWLGVAMGPVTPTGDRSMAGEESSGPGAHWNRWTVSVGNPHVVVLIDGPLPPLEQLETMLTSIETTATGPLNVEFVVRGPGAGALTLVVHERGAAWTQACGTGSVAAAWVAHRHGWVGPIVSVHNPGGMVQVDLSGPEARLSGPATFVAHVEVQP